MSLKSADMLHIQVPRPFCQVFIKAASQRTSKTVSQLLALTREGLVVWGKSSFFYNWVVQLTKRRTIPTRLLPFQSPFAFFAYLSISVRLIEIMYSCATSKKKRAWNHSPFLAPSPSLSSHAARCARRWRTATEQSWAQLSARGLNSGRKVHLDVIEWEEAANDKGKQEKRNGTQTEWTNGPPTRQTENKII